MDSFENCTILRGIGGGPDSKKCSDDVSHSLNRLLQAGYILDYIGQHYKGYKGGFWELRLQLMWALEVQMTRGPGTAMT